MPKPNPLARVVEAATRGPESVVRAASLLPRVDQLLSAAERLLLRVERLVDRLEQREQQLGAVVSGLGATRDSAQDVVDDASLLLGRARTLVDRYEPTLDDAVDTVSYASTRVGREQIDAIVAYLEFLPLLEAMNSDVVPTMRTLQTVAPDLTELLVVSKALNEMLGSLPGLGRVKKRVDEELQRDSDD